MSAPEATPLEVRLDRIADQLEQHLAEIRRLAREMRDGKEPDGRRPDA